MTKLERFLDFLYERATDDRFKVGYVGVIIKLPNQDKPELIINLPESLLNKMNYYKHAYNPDLTLISNPEVRILGYCYALEFDDLENCYKQYLEEIY
jgi:hypothetical protein